MLVDLRLPVTTDADFCSEAMLKGWKEDEKNTLSSDEQFAVYLKFYNECFKVGNTASVWVFHSVYCRGPHLRLSYAAPGRYAPRHPSLSRQLHGLSSL